MSLTSVIRYCRALDSGATDGSGKTSLAFGDFTAAYLTEGGTLTVLTTQTITTLGTYQAPTDASHIRIKELSSSDPTKGIYEVHFHNTQVAVAGARLWLFLSATGAAIQPLELDLITTAALPSAAAGASGGVPVIGTGANNFKSDSSANVTAASVAGNVGGNVAGNVAGDVQGKVLGGGASALTAVGVQADVEKWAGHTVAVDGNNLPAMNVTDWNGVAVGSLPTHFSALVIDGSGRVDLSRWNGTALAGTLPPDSVFIRTGTAEGGGPSSIILDAGAENTDNNFYQNCIVLIISGKGAGQCSIAVSYVASTRVLAINGTWAVQPDNSSVFLLMPFGAISANVSGNVTVGGYAGQDPATYILATPAQKIATDVGGRVNVGGWLDHSVQLDANNLPQIAVKDWNGVPVGALPANFSALGIGGTGHILNVDLTATATNVTNVVPLPTVDGKTFQQAMQFVAAMVAGKLPSGAGSGVEAYVGLDGSTVRVTMTIDSNGNRTAVAYG